MKIEVTKKDVAWSYIGTFMSLASNVILLPFIIYFLDEDMLGLWYIFTSLGAVATLFDFGFSVTFARNITYCWSGVSTLKKECVEFAQNNEPDYVLMKNIIVTCKRIYLLIASVVLLVLATGGSAYIVYVARGVQGHKYLIAWGLYIVATFLNLYYGYYASFLRGIGAVGQANQNTVIARAIQIVITIGCLFAGMGIIGACAAYLAYGHVFRILGKRKFYRYMNIGERLKEIETKTSAAEMKSLFFTVWHNAWREGLISLCNYCCNQISIIICSLYLSLAETGVYSLGIQVASAIAAVASALYSAYQPALQASYVTQDKEKTRDIMSLVVVLYIGLFIIGMVGVIVVGLPLLRMIQPTAVVSIGILVGLSVYQFLLQFRNCYTSYFSCTNRLPYVSAFVTSAILCVGLSFLFIGPLNLGIVGLIVAQIASQLVYNVWCWPIKAHREMELSPLDMLGRAGKQGLVILKSLRTRRT